jgi:hypothetical protein
MCFVWLFWMVVACVVGILLVAALVDAFVILIPVVAVAAVAVVVSDRKTPRRR